MIAAGLGYIPEDRHHEGIVPKFSVKENLVLKDFHTAQVQLVGACSSWGRSPATPESLKDVLRHPVLFHRRRREAPFPGGTSRR